MGTLKILRVQKLIKVIDMSCEFVVDVSTMCGAGVEGKRGHS